jgi:hypothetical protein
MGDILEPVDGLGCPGRIYATHVADDSFPVNLFAIAA